MEVSINDIGMLRSQLQNEYIQIGYNLRSRCLYKTGSLSIVIASSENPLNKMAIRLK